MWGQPSGVLECSGTLRNFLTFARTSRFSTFSAKEPSEQWFTRSLFLFIRRTSRHKIDTVEYAVKIVKLEPDDAKPIREAASLKSLSHKNVVSYCTSWAEKVSYVHNFWQVRKVYGVSFLLIQMQFCDGGSLRKANIDGRFVNNMTSTCKVFLGAASGLTYIHEKGIIHRDIKSVGGRL